MSKNMKKMISRMVSHRSFPYVMAFLMPFTICVVICIGNGVYPFGITVFCISICIISTVRFLQSFFIN